MIPPEDLARLHARAFAGQARAWGVDEFAALLHSPHVFLSGDARAFALGRVIADEVELLTIATDPTQRRQGLARACLSGFEQAAQTRGAITAFLEVAADNSPARTLYANAGYAQAGLRRGYYRREAGPAVDAMILRKPLVI